LLFKSTTEQFFRLFFNMRFNSMKRIVFSLLSAALLSTAIVPLAQASSSSVLTPRAVSPSSTVQSQVPSDVENPQNSPSPLEQRRLDELNRNGNQDGSLNRQSPIAQDDDVEPTGYPQMSLLQQRRLMRLDHRS
jgi:hypothetical protein